MKEILIEFERTGHVDPRQPVKIQLPGNWNEVSEDQFMNASCLLKDASVLEMNISVLDMINAFSNLNINKEFESITDISLARVVLAMKWVETLPPCNKFFINEFAGTRVSNPDVLEHSFQSVALGFYYFNKFSHDFEDPDICNPLRLIACFYHGNKKFNKNTINSFLNAPREECKQKFTAILTNMGLIEKYLRTEYPYVFKDQNKSNPGQLQLFCHPSNNNHTAGTVLKKLNLLIKDYDEKGVDHAAGLENILFPSDN